MNFSMDFFNPAVAALTMKHVVYTNDHMRDSSHRAIYNQFYYDRDILHQVVLDSTSFSRYNLNPAPLIANLGWSAVLCSPPPQVYPDIVYQFYANLKLAGPLCEGRFSTYVDGHIIFVTPLLLAQVLGLPNTGNKLFSCEDFRYFNFDPCAALSRWTGKTFTDHAVTDALSLPDHLKVFHFFLTRVLLPRSLGRDLVTPLDTWLMHCATMGIPVNFCCLLFATMANYGVPDYEGSLPFGPQICSLVAKLGIPLKYKFSEETSVEYLRAQHVLRRVGWSKCVPLPVNVSGGEIRYNCSGMDADVVNSAESDARARLTVWCDHDDASDFVESPDYHV
ncbi:hypothetical protein LINPERPRIM_LOCUS37369 [Linum perenne]